MNIEKINKSLNEIQKERKAEIKNHFDKILEQAKTYEQINGFYDRVGYMVLGMLRDDVLYNYYDYEGLKLYKKDIPLIELIFEEHDIKRRMLEGLE